MSSETILYDLPAKDGKSWSLNPWKPRMLLNFKGIPYKTEWVELPDIPAVVGSFGVDKNVNYFVDYSIPALRFNGKYIMTSEKIAPAIEAAYPNPPIHLDSPLVAQIQASVGETHAALRLIWISQIPDLLNKKSYDYFLKDREQRLGRPVKDILAEVKRGGPLVDEAWQKAAPTIEKIVGWLREKKEGPFLLGKEPSYADFILVTAMHFLKRVDETSLFDKFVSYGKELEEVYAASAKWLEKED